MTRYISRLTVYVMVIAILASMGTTVVPANPVHGSRFPADSTGNPTDPRFESGIGWVDDETINARVRFDTPPADDGCIWEKVRGSAPLPVPGTRPVEHETLYYRSCDDRVMSYHWIRNSTPKRIATSTSDSVSRLVNSLAVRTAPPSDKMVVNVGTWFWIPSMLWKPISVTAWIPTKVGPISVTTTATPRTLTYSPGDGNRPVSCRGPGRAWRSRDGDRRRSACMYTYRRATHRGDRHRYRATVTVTWSVSWRSSLGVGGVLPSIGTSAPLSVRVLELQALSR